MAELFTYAWLIQTLIVPFHIRCSTSAAHRLWGTLQLSLTRFLTWIPLWRWEARAWNTQRRERPPNCTAAQMETGWSRWAAASAALATRRATVTAKVGRSGGGCAVHRSASLSPSPDPASLSVPVHQLPAFLWAQLHLLSSASLGHFVCTSLTLLPLLLLRVAGFALFHSSLLFLTPVLSPLTSLAAL